MFTQISCSNKKSSELSELFIAEKFLYQQKLLLIID